MLGAGVVEAETQSGGFSHGVAVRALLTDGRRVFIKAIDADDGLAQMYRTEGRTAAQLPEAIPTPSLHASFDVEGWFVMVFDDVAGHHPRLDRDDERAAVLTTVEALRRLLTPNPILGVPTFAEVYGPELNTWQRFAEEGPPMDLDEWSSRNLARLASLEASWPGYVAGSTLLHTDLRPDNMLRRVDGSVVVIDWAWPCVGASWVDLAALVPSLAACGVDPDPILATHPATRDVAPVAVDAILCGVLGYWERTLRRPTPPRAPHLYRYRLEAARVTRQWLRRRVHWR
ncbi:phosphotransferase [Nocardia mikamii]|uniref:phosphotransferase n=1 Tax=Nocardia mikamii TaxID=508464 RepID=UPI0007A51E30|nr:phosphotransferase [Nocardia mikamii]